MKCGSSILGTDKPFDRRSNDQCEENCAGGKGGASVVWAIIIILVGLYIIVEVMKRVTDVPDWLEDFEFCWLVPVIIGIAIIATGIKMIFSNNKKDTSI
jgi:hypothetical protein